MSEKQPHNPVGAEMILRTLPNASVKAEIVPFTLLGLIRVPPERYTKGEDELIPRAILHLF
jgi:hypothetical protein